MRIIIELELLTIVVEIFQRPEGNANWSYAVLIPKLGEKAIRLTIPELCAALDRVALTGEA